MMIKESLAGGRRVFTILIGAGALITGTGCTSLETTCGRFEPKIVVDPHDTESQKPYAIRKMQRWSGSDVYGCTIPVANEPLFDESMEDGVEYAPPEDGY